MNTLAIDHSIIRQSSVRCALKQYSVGSGRRAIEVVVVIVLTFLAFAVRVHQIGLYSLSEDESAKWAAIQEYRQGHFAGVNSEHPMLPKVMSWCSLTAGEMWGKVAEAHRWASLPPEGWLRLPNVLLGALTAAMIYLLCRRLIGTVGALAAGFFWAVAPLPIALNRLTKEETPLTFFTVLACYFYCRAKQSEASGGSRIWYDLSALAFGLSIGSQYILHLFGLNALAWFVAGKRGLTPGPSQLNFKRFLAVMFLALVLVNPVILSPTNFHGIVQWLHHNTVRHTGYDFDGKLYLNFPARLLAGLPWFYYLWLLTVKTPLVILLAIAAGGVMLIRDRRSLASCFFLAFGVVQLIGLSVSGAKWIRYSLPLQPFLYLAGGYAVQRCWRVMREKAVPRAVFVTAGLLLFGSPIVDLHAWAPFYSFYLNPIGGGPRNVTRYFSPDEVSEFDTREVAQQVCPVAPRSATLATARPMSMAYYLQSCGRKDMKLVSLYDRGYVPHEGDLIVLEPSRRFFETQKFFDVLESSSMSHQDVRTGPVMASTIYEFEATTEAVNRLEEEPVGPGSRAGMRSRSGFMETASVHAITSGLSNITRRLTR